MNKKKLFICVTGIIALAVVGSMYLKINKLESDIQNLQNTQSSLISRLESRVSGIYDNVDEKLKKEASILSGYDFSYGEFNSDTHTALFNIKVIPKNITENTKVSAIINNNPYSFDTIDGNSYKGTIPFDVFKNNNDKILLKITNGANAQTEYLENVNTDEIWRDFLPEIQICDLLAIPDFGRELEYNGDIHLNINNQENNKFEKAEVVTFKNNKEVDTTDLTKYIQSEEEFYHVPFSKKYSATKNDNFLFKLRAVDSTGFIHEKFIDYWEYVEPAKNNSGPSPEPAPKEELYDNYTIKDKDGNILYERVK